MHVFEHKNIWRRVKRLWCNSASTNQLEESGDWRAHYWAQEHLKESQETLVQFCEHKPIRRIGRLWCNLASTEQLEVNWKTKVQLGQSCGLRVRSATRITEPGPQVRTEHWNWSTSETNKCIWSTRKDRIWRRPARKDREHLELTQRKLNLIPQGEDRTSESGQVGI